MSSQLSSKGVQIINPASAFQGSNHSNNYTLPVRTSLIPENVQDITI
jgi:hypothetical protein